MPEINGMPKMIDHPFLYVKIKTLRDKYNRKYDIYRVRRVPKKVQIYKIINYPFKRLGAPQINVKGNFGTGKSNLISLFTALYLAKKLNIVTFNDRRFEARHLAFYGSYDDKDNFVPFELDVFVPEGYKFKIRTDDPTPLWNVRNNVHLHNFTTADDIYNAMQPNHLVIVYTECFTTAGKLKLWIDLMNILAENVSVNKNYMYVDHELSSLIPEVPSKELYKLVRIAAQLFLSFRKDRIGVLGAYHMSSEVNYRFTRKFTYTLQKQPVNKTRLTKSEHAARAAAINEVFIVRAGFYRKMQIGLLKEVTKQYPLVPQRKKLNYPIGAPTDAISFDGLDEKDYMILVERAKGSSYNQIAKQLDIAVSTVYNRAKYLAITNK